MNKSSNALALRVLIGRNIKLYLKDKMTVFFSILAPVIVLLIYILFLGDLQADTIMQEIVDRGYGEMVTMAQVKAIVNNWMISGVMSVSCITVALSVNTIMVRDRQTGVVNDVIASPVKRWVLYLSYIISCFILTFCITFVVLMISIVYLACTGGLMMSFSDFLIILCIMFFSIMSSAFFMVLVCGFLKTTSSLASLSGVFGASIGFLIGAYMPFSMLPHYMQYIACFIPGTYSAGLFRNFFMRGIVDHVNIPADVLNELFDTYFNLDFFGHTITQGWMVLVLLLSIVVFGALILIFYTNKKTNFFAQGKKRRKNKK